MITITNLNPNIFNMISDEYGTRWIESVTEDEGGTYTVGLNEFVILKCNGPTITLDSRGVKIGIDAADFNEIIIR